MEAVRGVGVRPAHAGEDTAHEHLVVAWCRNRGGLDPWSVDVDDDPALVETHHVTGNFYHLLHVEVADLEAYEDFHGKRLADLPGVTVVNSYVVMKTMPSTRR